MNLCRKCVIRVDEGHDLCDACRDFKHGNVDWDAQQKDLKQLVGQYKPTGKYDAIVPLTGGKDSSFVLYYAVKVLKLKVLAFTWDNLLIRDTAMENIKNAVSATGVEHHMFKWDDRKMMTLHRSLFKHYATMCFCPVYLGLGVFPLAMEQEIPLIISGFSEGQRELDHTWSPPSQEQQKTSMEGFFHAWNHYMSSALKAQTPDDHDDIMDHLFGRLKPHVGMSVRKKRYPVMLPLSNYVNWTSMKDLEKIIETELGWKKPADTYMHTSCLIEPVRGYIEYEKKLNEMSNEMSNMIRIGAVTRDECLEEMTLMGMDGNRPDLTLHNKFLGISEIEFETALINNKTINPSVKPVIDDINASLAWLKGIQTIQAKSV